MKKKVFSIAFLVVFAACAVVGLAGCRKKGPLETAGQKTDQFGKDVVKDTKKLFK